MRLADLLGIHSVDGMVEDGVAENTVDVTRVVTEEDTTEGGKGAKEVGLPGDGSLDVLNVLGRGEVDFAARVLLVDLRHGGASSASPVKR